MIQQFGRWITLTGIMLAAPVAMAHAPVEREPEIFQTETRLFISDNENHDIIVLDVDTDDIVTRISVPPEVMSMGPTASGEYLIATRGRDTDRPYVTVVDTGLSPDEPHMRFPVVSRTLLLGSSISGVRTDGIATIGEYQAIMSEGDGPVYQFDESALDPANAFEAETFDIHPDHWHITELDDGQLLVGMLRHDRVDRLDEDRNVAESYECGRIHGAIRVGDRHFFGCRDHILVLMGAHSDELEVETRIDVPGDSSRVASFYRGNDRLWGGSENNPDAVWLNPETLEIGIDTFDSSLERLNVTPDGEKVLLLLTSGKLHIHDANTGDHLHMMELTGEFSRAERTTQGARTPTIEFANDMAFISLPKQGEVLAIALGDDPTVEHRWELGGMPTRIVPITS